MKSLVSLLVLSLFLAGNAFALDKAKLTQALDNPGRDAADKARDASRQPAEVLDFFGVEEGMTVLDIMASGGWYTEVLSYAAGPEGKVLMQNSPASLGQRGTEEAVTARLATNRLPNVQRVDQNLAEMDTPENSVDFAITALNYHDLYNSNPAAAQAMLAAVHKVLKPGGILGLIDHKGNFGADNAALHRIALEDVVMSVTEAGFAVVGYSDVLHSEDDDGTKGPFDPSLGRDTARLVVKLQKM
jgi:predicted methyltransferase